MQAGCMVTHTEQFLMLIFERKIKTERISGASNANTFLVTLLQNGGIYKRMAVLGYSVCNTQISQSINRLID